MLFSFLELSMQILINDVLCFEFIHTHTVQFITSACFTFMTNACNIKLHFYEEMHAIMD